MPVNTHKFPILTHQPGEVGYKTELLQKTVDLPIGAVLAYAAEQGVVISPAGARSQRSRVKRATPKTPRKQPTRTTRKPREVRTPATGVVTNPSSRYLVVPSSDPLQAMTNIIITLGIPGTHLLYQQALAVVRKKLGI
jgi:hypothetical protein